MEKENYTIEYINDIEGTDEYQEFINKIVKETKDGVSKDYKIEASYSDWSKSTTYSNTSAVANLFTNLPLVHFNSKRTINKKTRLYK